MKEDVKMWKDYKRTRSDLLRDTIVKRYLYLVKYVAGRIAIGLPPNIEFGDLVSYGILGLFDVLITIDQVRREERRQGKALRKPDPWPILEAAKRFSYRTPSRREGLLTLPCGTPSGCATNFS